MPPCARQPTTSTAAPPGRAEARSRTNGDPHLRKPAARPGAPSWPRPTGSSQVAQKRRFSGTIGSVITASAGSRAGTEGISTRPGVVDRVRRVADAVPDVIELSARLLLSQPGGQLRRLALGHEVNAELDAGHLHDGGRSCRAPGCARPTPACDSRLRDVQLRRKRTLREPVLGTEADQFDGELARRRCFTPAGTRRRH